MGLEELREIMRAGPPRPGLVPESGDPEHPYRWIRPEEQIVTPYAAGEKYHQPVPEVKYLAPDKLRRLDMHEVHAVSQEVAGQMRFDEPVEVSVFADGDLRITDGHHRVAAAKQLGMPAINVRLHAINARGEAINDLIRESQGHEAVGVSKAGPPRPGLVPKTGDWDNPGRWVLPEKDPVRESRTQPELGTPKLLTRLVSAKGRKLTPLETGMIESVARRVPKNHLTGLVGINLMDEVEDKELVLKDRAAWGAAVAYFSRNEISIFQDGMEPQVLIHEIGHLMHQRLFALLGAEGPYRAINIYKQAVKTGEGFPSEYSKEDFDEFMAESYSAHVYWPAKFQKRNPEMSALLDEMFERAADGIQLEEWMLAINKAPKGLIADPRGVGRFDPDLPDVGNEISKAGPPRPGLVPQSGRWDKPVRWIRPKDSKAALGVRSIVGSNQRLTEVVGVLSGHGKPYLVGGGVRDMLLGRGAKDFDIEVYGVSPDELGRVISEELGARGEQVGKQFGVFVVGDFDISLPRTEVKTGEKHTDFDVLPDPTLSLEEGARRRDFTINALMYDFESGQIHDFFGGLDDLRDGTIRHVSEETFVEDPLRVYRAAQFAARFGFGIHPDTVALARTMELSALPRERVYGEFKKLLAADTPSAGLQALDDMGVLERCYPELAALKTTPQRGDYHAEGDVFTHTKMVVDEAARVSKRFLEGKDALIITLAALLHDVGKPSTTKISDAGFPVQPGHEGAGVAPAREFLAKLTNEPDVIEEVSFLVEHHLTPLHFNRQQPPDSAFRRLINRHGLKRLELLAAVSEADNLGRLHRQLDGTVARPSNEPVDWFRERVREVSEKAGVSPAGTLAPLITGGDLLGMGMGQGRGLGGVLRDVGALQEEGILTTREEALEHVRGLLGKAIEKQGPPGPPPRPGLKWKPQTHRWIRSEGQLGSEGRPPVAKPSEREKEESGPEFFAHSIWYAMGEGAEDEEEIRFKASRVATEGLDLAGGGLRNVMTEELEENLGQEPAVYSLPSESWSADSDTITGAELIGTFFVIPGRKVAEASKVRDFEEAHKEVERDEPMAGWDIMTWRAKNERRFGEDISHIRAPEVLTTIPIPPGNLVGGFMIANRLGVGFGDKASKAEVLEVVRDLAGQKQAAGVVKAKLPSPFVHIPEAHDNMMVEADKRKRARGEARADLAALSGIVKQGPPGPPPRPGLVWKPKTCRWIRPEGAGTQLPTHIRGIKIPTSWTGTKIVDDPETGLLATGIQNGRKKYLYSVEHVERASAAKFARMKEFDKTLPVIRRAIRRDLQTDDAVDVLYLIDQTGFRIGSSRDTKAKKKAYGASTLLVSHVQVSGSTVRFAFVAKKGVDVQKTVKDPQLAKLLRERKKGKGRSERLFDANEGRVRRYLSTVTGRPFLVKDFRTWRGTTLAQRLVNEMPAPATPAEIKAAKRAVAERVSQDLGNTWQVSLSSYIAPEVFAPWDGALEKAALDFDVFEDVGYDADVVWTEEETGFDLDDDGGDEPEDKSSPVGGISYPNPGAPDYRTDLKKGLEVARGLLWRP